MSSTRAFLIFIAIVVLAGCSSNSQPASNNSSATPAAANPGSAPVNNEAQPDQVNACSLLTAADAEKIEGAPMQRSSIPKSPSVCRYDEVKPKPNAMSPAILSLTVDEAASVDEENRHWSRLKEVRHLEAGQKNVHVLSGIGEEAYFTGNTEKGKVGVASVIVRKGKYHFALDSMVLEYRASPDAMKSVATRIAQELK